MKTKNNLTTGILLGIGVIVFPLILMGTTYTTEKQNKFEFHSHNISPLDNSGYVINTENGDVWFVKNRKRTLVE